MAHTEIRKSNRLIKEKSPYLLQHAYNPVDWYPWGEEPFETAKREDKPVFLSIGYSTCHWCHVMERESFEDPAVASLLNEHFISVKVDREERPDLDHIYMTACQALTGHGGWPLTVFLTPDRKPFFAGTYFPRDSRHGVSGMMDLLPKLASLWNRERDKVVEAGEELLRALERQGGVREHSDGQMPGKEVLDLAYSRLRDSFDEIYGGFGGAPKFPAPHQLMFLLRYWKRSGENSALEMTSATLQAMSRGGIYDQLGYGFHRYATDAAWLVPHFEKMLYDQALLALAYLEAYQATGLHEFAVTARQTFEYLLRDMLSQDEAFCTAEDADTEGQEGLFYVWTPAEIKKLLGEKRGSIVCEYFGVTDEGNFEGESSILHRPYNKEQFARDKGINMDRLNEILGESREALLEARSLRVRPFRDDKVITAWNGLIIAALARGAAILDAPLYAQTAATAVAMIKSNLADDHRLLRRYRDGHAVGPAFLDDYAFMVWGLIELYQATFNTTFLRWACTLNDTMLQLFSNRAGGALNYSAASNDEELPDFQDAYDGAVPSGNSVAALNLLRLGRMMGRSELEQCGESIIRAFSRELQLSPTSFTFMLSALDFYHGSTSELVIAGDSGSDHVYRLAAAAWKPYLPGLTVLFHPAGVERKEIEPLAPFILEKKALNGAAAAYLCRNRSCLSPVTGPGQLAALLDESATGAD